MAPLESSPTKVRDDVLLHPGTIKNVDDWLPVTGSRNAKWWYSTFHNVTAMVGAGVLGLPSAMVYLGWGAGTTVLVASWLITLYTLWQMVMMHEMVEGKRFDRYHELGQEAFGERLGLWIVVPQQIIVEVGVDIVYMVTGGQSLWKFYQLIRCPDLDLKIHNSCNHIGKTAFIVIFASQHFFLAQLPNFNAISGISLAAAVMSLSYSTIAWADTVNVGQRSHDYRLPDTGTANLVFGAMNSLGTVAFAYAGHNVVLEIQATLPSTPERPSKVAMWRGVWCAYIVVALCYFPVSLAGYWAFGNTISGNILLELGKPRWLIAAANLMVVIHVTGSYQLYAMPVFDMLETVLVKKLHLPPSWQLRVVTRCSYVFATAFVACTIPFFDDLLGFLGGFAFAPTTYFLPCIIWLKIVKPKRFSVSWLLNWFLIIIGFLLAAVATIGGMRNIIKDASKYKFYQ